MSAIEREIVAQTVSAPAQWLQRVPDMPAGVGGVLARQHDGHCVFHVDTACAIQRAAGHAALPSACQHFPRLCLIDARGVFVTLSHYCPTAASMLFDDRPAIDVTRGFRFATIVEGPAALPSREIPEGLDARDVLPPMLTPRILMDHQSYEAWEQHMIRLLTTAHAPENALATLDAHAATLVRWRPGAGPLIDAVRATAAAPVVASDKTIDWDAVCRLFAITRASVPPTHTWPDMPSGAPRVWTERIAPHWREFAPVIGRYLAAHAFASWMAYQGNGIESIVRSLHVALATLRIEAARGCEITGESLDAARLQEAIRRADLLLRHLIDREQLVRRLVCPA